MNFKSLSLLLLFGLASCQEMMEGGEGSGSGSGGNNGGSGGSGGEMGEGGSDGGNDGSDDGKGEMDDYSGYNCTDNWEEQGCNNYAEWNGTIVVTTSSYNLRWLCYGCEWKKGFRTLFPGAEIYVTLDADCDSTDDVTSTDGGNDGSGENGGSGGENGGGSGGSGGSGGEGGEGSDSGKGEGGEETTVTRRLLTDTVTDSDTDSETIWENTNTASSYTITIEVAAIFYDCQALDALSTTFSDLAAEISDESEFMGLSDVTIQCSELDCCEDDDVCSPFKYCDTDGDGNYDTYDTDGDGVNDAQGNDSGANNSYDVMFSFVACIFALMSLVY